MNFFVKYFLTSLIILFCYNTDVFSYVMPLKGKLKITSSFGESRGSHVHSGLDFSTGGITGIPVFAVEDGKVVRVSFSPWGYGKVIYILGNNGKTTVYAHLSRLIPPLEKAVYKEQLKRGRYKVNIVFPKKKMHKIKKGQLIAYSGETGVGYPHLHFEIRDENGYPLNALLNGFPIPDKYAPVIKKVMIKPFASLTTVNSKNKNFMWKTKKENWKRYTLIDTPWVSGNVGLSVLEKDVITKGGYSVCSYKRDLYIDDSLVYSASYDTLPYQVSKYNQLTRDMEYMIKGLGKFEHLYIEPLDKLPIYGNFKEGDGILNSTSLGYGLHKIRIDISDAAGNKTITRGVIGIGLPPIFKSLDIRKNKKGYMVSLQIIRGSFPLSKITVRKKEDGTKWEILKVRTKNLSDSPVNVLIKNDELKNDTCFYLQTEVADSLGNTSKKIYSVWNTHPRNIFSDSIKIEFKRERAFFSIPVDKKSTAKPQLHLTLNEDMKSSVKLERNKLNLWSGSVSLAGLYIENGLAKAVFPKDSIFTVKKFKSAFVTPQRGAYLVSPDNMFSVDIPSECVIRPFVAEILENNKIDTKNNKAIYCQSKVYTLNPSTFFADKPIEVAIKTNGKLENMEQTGLFGWNGKRWNFCSNNYDKEKNIIKYRSRSIGTFAIFTDTIAPVVYHLSVRNNGSKKYGRRISFRIKEDGSGTGSDINIITKIDKRVFINELDPERNRVVILRTNRLRRGFHSLSITVKDQLGNKSEKKLRFKVR